jgi:ribosome-associated protein
MLVITPQLSIPLREIEFSYARSGGPGGQNVNKVNSKATLRWNATTSSALPEEIRQRLIVRYSKRLTVEGELIVTSQRFRDAGRNTADCLEKLRELVLAVTVVPKTRRPTKPSRGAKRRRLEDKRRQSTRKSDRRFTGE